MDTYGNDTYWQDTCIPFEWIRIDWIRIEWIRIGGIHIEWIRMEKIRIDRIRVEWISVGWCLLICMVWDTPTIFWRSLRRNVFREWAYNFLGISIVTGSALAAIVYQHSYFLMHHFCSVKAAFWVQVVKSCQSKFNRGQHELLFSMVLVLVGKLVAGTSLGM